MTRRVWIGAAVGCFVVTGILLFVAIERYEDNAAKVRAIRDFGRQTPFGGLLGEAELRPATPAATKYAALFAVLTGIGGIACLVCAGTLKARGPASGGGVPPSDKPGAV